MAYIMHDIPNQHVVFFPQAPKLGLFVWIQKVFANTIGLSHNGSCSYYIYIHSIDFNRVCMRECIKMVTFGSQLLSVLSCSYASRLLYVRYDNNYWKEKKRKWHYQIVFIHRVMYLLQKNYLNQSALLIERDIGIV